MHQNCNEDKENYLAKGATESKLIVTRSFNVRM
jgi:hypothetical protein